MAGRPYRIGVVGASSLAGKELTEALAESTLAASDFVLLDNDDAGQIAAAGDEATFIQKIDSGSFAGLDFVFFAGDPETTTKYWKTARRAGASIVDMTYALEAEAGVVVRGPWAGVSAEARTQPGVQEPDLATPAVVSAHPAALMLSLVTNRLHAKSPVRAVSATVFEPASEHGRAAMDELHQQTVSLLSFQSLPREQFDAQVAFNLLPSLGEAAKIKFGASRNRIVEQFTALAIEGLPQIAVQLIQPPVFHGYAASMLVELTGTATLGTMELAALGERVDIVGSESDAPSNLSATGQPDVLVRISGAAVGDKPTSRFWVWLAADNLKVAALNAIACANELGRLRPQGKVQ